MSEQTYQAIWECDPACSMFRLITLAKPELLDMLVEARAVPIGPVHWSHRGDRFLATVAVRVLDDWPSEAYVAPEIPDPDELALVA